MLKKLFQYFHIKQYFSNIPSSCSNTLNTCYGPDCVRKNYTEKEAVEAVTNELKGTPDRKDKGMGEMAGFEEEEMVDSESGSSINMRKYIILFDYFDTLTVFLRLFY